MPRLRMIRLSTPVYIISAVIAVIIVLVILELTNTTHLFHKPPTPAVIPVSNSTTNQPQAASSNSSSGNTPSTNTSSKTPGTSGGASSGAVLLAPYGDFVSNHHPNLSGSPAPSTETSVCDTTPGASCYIQFTNGATTTKLPVKVVDSSGAAVWNWDVNKDAHLSTGEWTITAIAGLNGVSKSTQDPLKLSVGP